MSTVMTGRMLPIARVFLHQLLLRKLVVISCHSQKIVQSFLLSSIHPGTMLLTDLSQTPGLDVVSSERIHEILKQVGGENLEIIDKSLVSEVARRAGAGAVVVGSIFKSGPEVRIDVQVEDVGSGRILSAESVRGKDVFPLVDELSSRVRASLELDMGDQPSVRSITEVMTASLEAFRLYSEGLEAQRHGRGADAWRLFEEAVKVDPSFAMAYFELSRMGLRARMGPGNGSSEQYRQKVLENLDRLPERQRLFVQATYANEEERDPEKAAELLESLVALYPDAEVGYTRLAHIYNRLGQSQEALAAFERGARELPQSAIHVGYGYQLLDAGRYPEAFRELETYARLYPNEPNPYDSLAEAYLISGQPEKALENYARALELEPDWGRLGLAWAYGVLGRYEEAFAERAKEGKWHELQGGTDPGFVTAFMLSRLGRYREAEELMQRIADLSAQIDFPLGLGAVEVLSSLLALEREDYSHVSEKTKRAKEHISRLGNLQQVLPMVLADLLAGVAEARSGSLEAARARLDSQEELYDSRIPWEKWFYHALAGEIALASGDLAAAESAFTAGEPEFKMDFDLGNFVRNVFANCLPFRDGRARVMKVRGDLRGAVEFYRNLNHPDIRNKWTAFLEPRYVLEVALLLDELDDTEGAQAEYERFLELWKDADPELPELAEAKRYLAKESP